MVYDLIIANKELLKVIYGLAIGLICLVIVLKTHKLFKLSMHQGIRYFRNAFFFYGIGFSTRFIIGATSNLFPDHSIVFYYLTRTLFEFFLVMAGFFLLYSLLWKRIEGVKKVHFTSLFNSHVGVFYLMAIIIIILDNLWNAYYFMFCSQIILFIIASALSYNNYIKNGTKHKFLKYYFISMVLSLIAWVLNAILSWYLNWNEAVLINVYAINVIFFLMFLVGVMRVTRKSRDLT